MSDPRPMRRIRDLVAWLAGWIVFATVLLAGYVTFILIRGGEFHRTPTCDRAGTGLVVNIYVAAVLCAWIALAFALGYAALGAATPVRRLIRLVTFAVAWMALAVVVVGITWDFSGACT